METNRLILDTDWAMKTSIDEIRELPSVYPKSDKPSDGVDHCIETIEKAKALISEENSKAEELIDKLEKLRFFNQRAGRELWQDKPVYIQQLDIADAEETLTEAINYIRSYPKSDKSVLEDIKQIVDSYYEEDYPTMTGAYMGKIKEIVDKHISNIR